MPQPWADIHNPGGVDNKPEVFMQPASPLILLEQAQCCHARAGFLENLARWYRRQEACLLEQAKQQTWHIQNDRDAALERTQELLQRANPVHDGYALADTEEWR
jgi:hypothetical protein